MKRVENWKSKLFNFIKSRQNTPMEWGKSDCFLLAFDASKIITGVEPDFGKPFRGRYRTAGGAYRLLKKYAGDGLLKTCDVVAEKLNIQEKPVNYAQTGDIALFESESVIGGVREIMGVVLGSVSALQGKDGLVFKNTNEAKKVWKI
jgi:hypothetical protein